MDQLPLIFSIDGASLRAIGLRAIAMIRERTLQGQGVDAPFRGYSTTPFARPLGGITQRARAALGDQLKVFTSKKSGKLWAIIEGGYEAYKRAAYPADGSTVNLSATGAMLRALTVVSVDEASATVTLGFTRTEEALKALYHDQIGVGKGRVVRHFLGLTAAEREDLARLASQTITVRP